VEPLKQMIEQRSVTRKNTKEQACQQTSAHTHTPLQCEGVVAPNADYVDTSECSVRQTNVKLLLHRDLTSHAQGSTPRAEEHNALSVMNHTRRTQQQHSSNTAAIQRQHSRSTAATQQ
jgi:hypothetical protein